MAGITGLRLLIHISTNNFNNRLLAIDVKTAFLNARTTLPKYYNLPIGHVKRKGLSKVWKSHCALYGLSDSSFHWYHCLVTFLNNIALK